MRNPEIGVGDLNRLLTGLLLFECFLVAIYVADVLLHHPIGVISALIDLDAEGTVPAWFSSLQLFSIGMVFLLNGRFTASLERPSPGFFMLIGVGFIFLSLDESASIHEKITTVLKRFDWVPRFKGDHGIWIPIYLLVSSVIVAFTYPHFRSIWLKAPREFIIMALGAVLLLLGVVGLEIISYEFLRVGASALLYKLEVAIEEFLEMTGASLILYGTLRLMLSKRL